VRPSSRAPGGPGIVALGHLRDDPRFGFALASAKGLRCEYPVPDDALMVIDLTPGALRGRAGLVKCHPEFGRV